MSKVLMPALLRLGAQEFTEALHDHLQGKDFEHTYVVDVQMLNLNTLRVTMNDSTQFEITCKSIT